MTETLEEMSEKLATFTSAAQFEGSIGRWFRASWGTEDSVALELVSATSIGKVLRRENGREPFSLIFRSAEKQVSLAQGNYQLESDTQDPLLVFLVPIGPDETGMRLEAIFN